MSRPKKERKPPRDNRVKDDHFHPPGAVRYKIVDGGLVEDENQDGVDNPSDFEKEIAAARRDGNAWIAGIDPKNEDPELASLMVFALVNRKLLEFFKSNKNKVSDFMLKLITDSTADEAEAVFARIVKLKRNNEFKDRRAYAVKAYRDYFSEAGKEPTKPQLKAYMQARRSIYKDQPGPDEPWTRLWKETGLFGMSDR